MAPRNPGESSEEGEQNKVLLIHGAPTADVNAAGDPEQQGTSVPKPRQVEALDTKAELDRLEIYLKGPTVFSA